VNLGDVMVEGAQIYGDGVNVAEGQNKYYQSNQRRQFLRRFHFHLSSDSRPQPSDRVTEGNCVVTVSAEVFGWWWGPTDRPELTKPLA
jgi:hypothetical protein